MIFPRVVRRPDGSVAFENLMPIHVAALLEAPDLIEKPGDPVRRRLFPEPGEDAKQREDWERLVRPELFALVASAREVLKRDLQRLEPARAVQSLARWRIEIPAPHVNAWISALNAARLALGAIHGIESEEELHPDLAPKEGRIEVDERTLAILKINVLGELQAALILDGAGHGDGEEEPA